MHVPDELRYTREHEWARIDENKKIATIGVTDYAQEKLGDVVYVELPGESDEVRQEEPFGTVESVKAVSDLYAPVSGTVLEINDALAESPETVNDDPYGEGWMVRVQYADAKDLDRLLTAEDYRKFLAEQDEET